MLSRTIDCPIGHKGRRRIAIELAKGSASRAALRVDVQQPATWKFSGFSQNGEDGIIDVLCDQLKHSNRYIVEIGDAGWTESNSSWPLTTAGYEDLMIEGHPCQSARTRRNVGCCATGSQFVSMFVMPGTVDVILEKLVFRNSGVFSLDIDGDDWRIANALFACEFWPKIVSMEYNSVFGSKPSVTSMYRDDFRCSTAHSSKLYYCVSVAVWRDFFDKRGHRFVTSDSNGANVFLLDGLQLDDAFMAGLRPRQGFIENRYQLRAYSCDHVGQFAMIADQPLEQV